jgi:hypothetical protein
MRRFSMNNPDYMNSLINDLLEVLWEEHGTGVRYRTTLVGTTYFKEKYGDRLIGKTWRETVDAVLLALKQEGLIAEAAFESEGYLLRLTFRGCRHLETERLLLGKGMKVFSCQCANVVMYFLDRLVGKYSELATVEVGDNECTANFCVMGSALSKPV